MIIPPEAWKYFDDSETSSASRVLSALSHMVLTLPVPGFGRAKLRTVREAVTS